MIREYHTNNGRIVKYNEGLRDDQGRLRQVWDIERKELVNIPLLPEDDLSDEDCWKYET